MSSEVVYRIKDNLKNFCIKVELRRVTASGLSCTTGTNVLRETLGGQPGGATVQQQLDTERWVFRMQEKAFSQAEEECFADLNNCTNALQEKYHRDILAIRNKGGRPNNRLFSYVDSDPGPLWSEEDELLIGTDFEPPVTFAAHHGSSVRRRGPGTRAIHDPVVSKPTQDQRLNHRLITPPVQNMYLMADLRRMDSRDEADEYVLCHIKVDSDGVLVMCPDFTRDRATYRIQNRHNEIFEYKLEHASESISPEDELKERKLLSEIYSRHASVMASSVGSNFEEPPEGDALSIQIYGEIVSAQGFEYDDLYVKAVLELPEFWQVEDEQSVTQVTQLSRTKSGHKCNVAHFNFPLEYHIKYDNPTDEDELSRWPRVLLQVASLDYWDRHRIEGYGCVDLPSEPGSHRFTVHTWRPLGSRVVDRMRRFFIGGPPELQDVSHISQPADFQGTHLSKFGFRTESSGSVLLCFSCVHQSRSILEKASADKIKILVKHRGFKTSVLATLDAYRRAKQKAASVSATL